MYLIEPKLYKITKKQYFFKLKTNFGLFFSLIIVQVCAIFLSMGGTSSSGFGGSGVTINTSYISGNIVIIFTLIWTFAISFMLTTTDNRNIDFTFVSNRLTSNFSNIGFLITLSFYTSLTASLSSNFIRVLFYFISDSKNIVNTGFIVSPQYILMNIISMLLYIVLISSIGYFLGSLTHLSKIFTVLLCAIPVVMIFGFRLFSSSINSTFSDLIKNIFNFYFAENSLLIFAVKVLITTFAFFLSTVLISNTLEVK